MQPPDTITVVYDVADTVFPRWPVAAVGLVVGVAGLALLRRDDRAARPSRARRIVASTLVVFGPCWALFVGAALFAQHHRLRRALDGGDFTRYEGIVYDRPVNGDGANWLVDDDGRAHWYRYDRLGLSPGYRRAGPGDGGLREGSRVRVVDVRGRIGRVEVVTSR